MFEYLKEYDKILVTGPQCSGTNICARMIAQDTGHSFVPAQSIGIGQLDMLNEVWKSGHQIVVHGPAFSFYCYLFGVQDALIVFMRRNLQDIYASRRRINWLGGCEEIEKFMMQLDERGQKILSQAMELMSPEILSAVLKHLFWELYQRSLIFHYLEIEYESLASHSLWVPKEKRVNWEPLQTSVDWEPY